jgi:hypothetical protein
MLEIQRHLFGRTVSQIASEYNERASHKHLLACGPNIYKLFTLRSTNESWCNIIILNVLAPIEEKSLCG